MVVELDRGSAAGLEPMTADDDDVTGERVQVLEIRDRSARHDRDRDVVRQRSQHRQHAREQLGSFSARHDRSEHAVDVEAEHEPAAVAGHGGRELGRIDQLRVHDASFNPSRKARAQPATSDDRTAARIATIRWRRSWRFMSTAVMIAVFELPLVVGVDEHRVAQLVGGPGELRQHQHAVVVEAGRDELLGDEVHAVAERCHEQHIGGAVERHELVERQRPVQVVDDRIAEPGVTAVDLTDGALDVVALVDVLVDSLTGRCRHLHEHVALGIETAGVEQRTERAEAVADALGVVEPVDAEQDHLGVAQAGADRAGPPARRPPGGERLELLDVDRDRERSDVCDTVVAAHVGAVDLRVEQSAGGGDEVLGAELALEPEQIGAEQPASRSPRATGCGRTARTAGTGCG